MMWLAIRDLPGNHYHSSKGFIRRPTDFRGKSVSALGDVGDLVTRIGGGTAVSLVAGDMYHALQTGLVEGVFMHMPAVDAFRLNEVTRYHTMFGQGGINTVAQGIIMNSRSFDRLTPQDQKIVQETFQAALDETVKAHADTIEQLNAKMRQAGNQVHTLTDAEMAVWYAAAEHFITVWKTRTDAAGFDADAMYRKYLEIVRRHM